ncbi:MAG: N-acetyl sugar amidotransferase [Desulfovibrionaceae bacterium]|nr:N-acetyl sugar amidotransferase [Desulfovibrionaceae bacterium]
MSDHKKKYFVHPERPPKMRYCSRCVSPMSSAAPITFDDNGVCSTCKVANQRDSVDWDARMKKFERLCDRYRSKDGMHYDCIIPVSGGKDSYFQVHIMKNVLGMNPLLVTYHGNNYLPTGMENLRNMREVFGCDHIFFTPSIRVLKAMNRLCMHIMGDMNWHAHCGINTYPIRVAVETNTPLMIWGEHGFMDIGGMHSYNDFVEFTYRNRHEHDLRGYEWYDILAEAEKYGEELETKDMIPFMHPSDEDMERVGVRGIHLNNYVRWDANTHGPLMEKLYGFKESPEEFERTYRRMSNLDDMHENGIHDYLKYIKFGYGRATDHACKDIRAGLMTREQAVEEVRKRDHIKSKDIWRWLDYVGWTEQYFDEVCDRFRDPRVWWKGPDGEWMKDNLWDED